MTDNLIIHAAQFAARSHHGQKRKWSDVPYIVHPGRVAAQLSCHWRATPELIAAAWLHDVVEDCGVAIWEISDRFGARVADLVMSLSNPVHLEGYKNANRAARKAINRNWLKAGSSDAKLIKLVDRIDNLSDVFNSKDDEFELLYKQESQLLLDEVLVGTDVALEAKLQSLISA